MIWEAFTEEVTVILDHAGWAGAPWEENMENVGREPGLLRSGRTLLGVPQAGAQAADLEGQSDGAACLPLKGCPSMGRAGHMSTPQPSLPLMWAPSQWLPGTPRGRRPRPGT